MSKLKIFISPSSQEANPYIIGGTEEAVMNLIADAMIPELVRHGVEVMRNDRKDTYTHHIEKSNKFAPDLHLAIHSNAMDEANSGKARGCEVFCYAPENPAVVGTQFAEKVYKYISAMTPTSDRGIKSGRSSISEVKYTHAPAVLVEIAFHDNPLDARWIVDNIEPISHGLLLATLEQFKIPYMPPVPVKENAVRIAELNRLVSLMQKQIDGLV